MEKSLSSDPERDVASGGASSASADGDDAGYRIWLYSRDGEDTPVDLESLPDLDGTQVLWADVDLESAEGLDRLWEHLDVGGLVDELEEFGRRPTLHYHDGVMQLTVIALGDGAGFEPMALYCLMGSNWVVTLHEGELDLVDEFNEPFHGETRLGDLDGPKFLSLVLDWQLSGYFGVIEELQEEIDLLDEEVLAHPPDEGDLLTRLLDLRRRVRELRKVLSPHRQVLGLLGHPESGAVVDTEAADVYQRVEERLQQALDEVETAREMIVGSFDIFMTRTSQATNDIMKRLTIVSVLLLPAVVIAGIMGMNFAVGLFDAAWLFWVVIAVMAALAGFTLIIAKRRGWI